MIFVCPIPIQLVVIPHTKPLPFQPFSFRTLSLRVTSNIDLSIFLESFVMAIFACVVSCSYLLVLHLVYLVVLSALFQTSRVESNFENFSLQISMPEVHCILLPPDLFQYTLWILTTPNATILLYSQIHISQINKNEIHRLKDKFFIKRKSI